MAAAKQYQAQQMSIDWANFASQAKNYASDQYKSMMKDSTAIAERKAQESAKQRASDETRTRYDADSRVMSSQAGAAGQGQAAALNNLDALYKYSDTTKAERKEMAFNDRAKQLSDEAFGGNSGGGRGGGGGSSSSSGSAFGNWSGSTVQGMFGYGDINGMNDFSRKTYESQRNEAVETARRITKAEASGDIARTEAQAEQQRNNMLAQSNIDFQRMNREASLKSQADANARMFQSGESDKDRANQRYLAGVDANSRLFASLNQGQGGFQYWGGSI